MIYILHFDTPLHYARHYVGYCADGTLDERLARHRAGHGSRLMAAIEEAGIGYTVALTHPGDRRAGDQTRQEHGTLRSAVSLIANQGGMPSREASHGLLAVKPTAHSRGLTDRACRAALRAGNPARRRTVMSTSQPVKFPEVHVQLSGEDGNVFSIIGRVSQALRRAGCAPSEIDAFLKEVQSSQSYDEALRVVMQWVSVS